MNQYQQVLTHEQDKARDLNEKISKTINDIDGGTGAEKLQKTLSITKSLVQWSQELSECLEMIRVNLIEAKAGVDSKTKTTLGFDLYIATLKIYREVLDIQDNYYKGLIKDIEMYFVNESKITKHNQIEQKKTKMMLLYNINDKIGSIKKNTHFLTETLSAIIERMDEFNQNP